MYRQLLRPGSLVFDVGANLGQKSDIFLAAGFRSIVIEPNIHCQQSLELQFLDHPRAVLVRKAVGAAAGRSILYADGSDAAASLLPEWNKKLYGDERSVRSQDVEVTTLDELIKTFGRPDYIKIDVEGYENEVLKGLTQPVPVLSFEFHASEIGKMRYCLETTNRLGSSMFRATDMHGHWICAATNDAEWLISFIQKTKCNGDLYVWMI